MEITFGTLNGCPVIFGRTTELDGLRFRLERVKSGAGQVFAKAVVEYLQEWKCDSHFGSSDVWIIAVGPKT